MRLYFANVPVCYVLALYKMATYKNLCIVTNPTVYNRSIYKYNLIDVYKYNHMLL